MTASGNGFFLSYVCYNSRIEEQTFLVDSHIMGDLNTKSVPLDCLLRSKANICNEDEDHNILRYLETQRSNEMGSICKI